MSGGPPYDQHADIDRNPAGRTRTKVGERDDPVREETVLRAVGPASGAVSPARRGRLGGRDVHRRGDRVRRVPAGRRARRGRGSGSGPVGATRIRSAGKRQLTDTLTVCQPRAPSGAGGDGCSGWTAPVPSVARTLITWPPGCAAQSYTHWTHVASEIGRDSVASLHRPSIETSTREMPLSGAHAMP